MGEVLRIDLSKVGRASVLQLVEAQALTGRLVAELAGAEVGWADFLDGRPVSAARGSVTGVDALYDLLIVEASTMRLVAFDEGRLPEARAPLADGLSLVMEGCRLRDEFVRLSEQVVRLAHPAPPELSAEVRRVLAQLDGRIPLSTAVARADASPSRVVEPLQQLLEQGVLVSIAPPPAALAGTGFHDALAAGRTHLRSGDLDRAEIAFHQALTLRPDDPIARQNLRRVRELRAQTWVERIPSPQGAQRRTS